MSVLELLNKRFATKKFDSTKTISAEDMAYILECGRVSCSSLNTQPWKIIVVTNPEIRSKLAAAGYNQPQYTEASALLVLCAVKDPMGRVNTTTNLISASAGQEQADGYKNMVTGSLSRMDAPSTAAWLARQTYLCMQALILGAIDRGIDSCPMEGLDTNAWTEILGLQDATVIANIAIGYAAAPGYAKIRVPLEDIVEYRA
ncbi:MAG: NAD(P)H-dependent oxidoreductase [Candidatus Uhrbacteria bacterium]